MTRYRDATLADAQAIAALFADCFTTTFGALYAPHNLALFLSQQSPHAFAEQLADPDFAFRLAEKDGRLVGFVKLGPPDLPGDTPPATIELRQLYVLPAWQGAGVAAALTDWAFAEARRRAKRHLQLSVFVDNPRARRFYEKRGFVEVGEYQFMVGDHVDDDRVMRVAL